ncbi:Pseudaminic acid cytidylyltransferase [hydrothermal vent metagenome]|uniref:Pseudaminic acid cytidylyltransferase n=1 Tax=hydrothermal vent metagenome TaxID=652676 RepID=A0A1W1BQY4_9ZZZZ
MRDLVLAKRDFKDDSVIFATRDLEGNINHKIKEAGYQIELLNSNDIEELDTVIKKYSADMIVIDNYEIDYTFEKKLLALNPQLSTLVLDDTYEKHYCDILLNHNISADAKRYKGLVPKHCKLLCGSRYTLLRDEFYEAKKRYKKLKTQNSKLKVLVMMGGSDGKNLTPKILNVLEDFNDIEIDVVTTTANRHLKELQEYIATQKNVTLHINSQEVAKLMALSDLAILTPSVTVNEAYFMELPFIAIQTETNQEEIANYLRETGYNVLNEFDTKKLKKILKERL